MTHPPIVRETLDALHANVAVLDSKGAVIEVNESWRRYGGQRDARSDFVGLNYLQVCANAAANGDRSARRVADGLRRLLDGSADSYGLAYQCAERTFPMVARRLSEPAGGLIVAHQDISALVTARQERNQSRRKLEKVQRNHAGRIEQAHEELGQKLTAISLAAIALERGGDVADAVPLIKLAVDEARQELKLLRYDAAPE